VDCPVISFELFATSIIFLIIEKFFEFIDREVPWRISASFSFKPLVVLLVVKLLYVNINLLDFNKFIWEVWIDLLITCVLVVLRVWNLVDEPSVDVVITAFVHYIWLFE